MHTVFEVWERLQQYTHSVPSLSQNKFMDSLCANAAMDGYRDFVTRYAWSHYFANTIVDQAAKVDRTIAYDASTRIVTVTGSIPSWWANSLLYVPALTGTNHSAYFLEPIAKPSSTTLEVDAKEVLFDSNVASGSPATFFHAFLQVPDDIYAIGGVRDNKLDRWLHLVPPAETMLLNNDRFILNRDSFRAGIRPRGTSRVLVLDAMPHERRTYEMVYYRQPVWDQLRYIRNPQARVSITSNTATVSRISLKSTDVGSYLVISEDESLPSGMLVKQDGTGDVAQTVKITAVTDASTCTVEGATNCTDKGLVLTPKLDISESMYAGVLRCAERELARSLGNQEYKEFQIRDRVAYDEQMRAQAQDPSIEYRTSPYTNWRNVETWAYGLLAQRL